VTDAAQSPADRLTSVPAYVAGQPAPEGAYKLSSNENPFPPLPAVVAAIVDGAGDVNRYPDFGNTALIESIATFHQLSPAQVVVSTGSVAVLQAVCSAFAGDGDEIVYSWRSFEAYPIVVAVSGATPRPVALQPDERHAIDAMRNAVNEHTKAVLLCSPNNPTGTVLTRAEVEQFLSSVPSHVLVVLDEAYVEFVRDTDAVVGTELLGRYDNLVLLRTFSKAYALAGMRVGYALASPGVAAGIRKAQTPFGVTALAQRAAIAALGSQSQVRARVDVVVAERERLLAHLREQGWSVPASQGNFVWLRLGQRTAEFAADCRDAGVIVRAFAGEGVRVTIGELPANRRILDVTARWAQTVSPSIGS
jgi:histidinol-phosphate aminotransferase